MPRSCGSVQNYFRQVDFYPDLRRNQAVLEGITAVAARQGARARLPEEIPVVVHILYRTEADNLSDDQVASQITVLNEDYSATNDDLKDLPPAFTDRIGNPGLRFALATTDPDGAATNGITRKKVPATSFAVDDRMKAAATGGVDPWDTTRYLNIWVCRLSGGVLGYAQFPGGPPETDGVVILTSAFGDKGSAEAPFDLGVPPRTKSGITSTCPTSGARPGCRRAPTPIRSTTPRTNGGRTSASRCSPRHRVTTPRTATCS